MPPEDESEWVEVAGRICIFSGAFPLVGDDDLAESETGETRKAERMLFDRDDRGRSAAGFCGDCAFCARSISFLHTLKKSVKV